jgi:hypothetical protein
MGKFRKTLKKKINPAKSNRIIILVGAGLLVLFLALFIISINPGTPSNKGEVMDQSLAYLKKSLDGILAIKTYPDQNKAVIIYDSLRRERESDFVYSARLAGIRLSNALGNIDVTLILSRDKEETQVRTYMLKGGKLLQETEVQ